MYDGAPKKYYFIDVWTMKNTQDYVSCLSETINRQRSLPVWVPADTVFPSRAAYHVFFACTTTLSLATRQLLPRFCFKSVVVS